MAARRRIHTCRLSADLTVEVVLCAPLKTKGDKDKNMVMVESVDATRLITVEASSLTPTDKFE
jgi:hypothetical protein